MNTVRELLRLRNAERSLQADGDFEIIYAKEGENGIAWRRGDLLLALNPSQEKAVIPIEEDKKEIIYSIGKGIVQKRKICLEAQSFVIFR